jgi:hypothetical protein
LLTVPLNIVSFLGVLAVLILYYGRIERSNQALPGCQKER